jgi:hypothetical protein
MAKKIKRKRSGMPRRNPEVRRITMRINIDLASKMNAACEQLDITQRTFVEQAIREYCKTPLRDDGMAESTEPAYRTGVWIDPALVRMMDRREAAENIRQRALLERAISARLQRIGQAV